MAQSIDINEGDEMYLTQSNTETSMRHNFDVLLNPFSRQSNRLRRIKYARKKKNIQSLLYNKDLNQQKLQLADVNTPLVQFLGDSGLRVVPVFLPNNTNVPKIIFFVYTQHVSPPSQKRELRVCFNRKNIADSRIQKAFVSNVIES